MGLKPRPKTPRYDEHLAERIRAILGPRSDVVEKRMFGGLAFMVRGHMSVGITRRDLLVRVGAQAWETAVALPGARPMDFTGTPLRGFVYVSPRAVADRRGLAAWVNRGVAFAESMPRK